MNKSQLCISRSTRQGRQAHSKNESEEPQSSYRTETLGRKTFRILTVPSITRPIIAQPEAPSPTYPKRRTEPTVDSFHVVRSCIRPAFKKDAKWAGRCGRLPIPDKRPRPFTEPRYQSLCADEDALNAGGAVLNKDEILRRRTPRAPRGSDRRGFVPTELRFTQYCFGMQSPVRTEAESKRGFWVGKDGNPEIPRIKLGDLLPFLPDEPDDWKGYLALLSSGHHYLRDDYSEECLDRRVEIIPDGNHPTRSHGKRYIKPHVRELLKITRLQARGLTQAEIGKRMHLSPRQIQLRCDEIRRIITSRGRWKQTTLVN
jgi:hypothetical protein